MTEPERDDGLVPIADGVLATREEAARLDDDKDAFGMAFAEVANGRVLRVVPPSSVQRGADGIVTVAAESPARLVLALTRTARHVLVVDDPGPAFVKAISDRVDEHAEHLATLKATADGGPPRNRHERRAAARKARRGGRDHG